jgi:hypothetical protein
MPNYNSIYLENAGRTQTWVGLDNEIHYQENLQRHKDILEQNGWIGDQARFNYKFNSNGFRCDEFTTDPTIMFLGCSLTVGVGLPVDAIWPELVSRELGLRCANLGQGGGSADTAFRLCHGWIDQICPKRVIYLKPPGTRWEMLVQERTMMFNVYWRRHPRRKEGVEYETYVDDYLSDENNQYFNDLKNTMGIEQICRSRGVDLHIFNTSDLIDLWIPKSKARDCGHPGVDTHTAFAQQVIKEINHG